MGRVFRIENLKVSGRFEKNDYILLVNVGKEDRKSKVKTGESVIEWNETFDFMDCPSNVNIILKLVLPHKIRIWKEGTIVAQWEEALSYDLLGRKDLTSLTQVNGTNYKLEWSTTFPSRLDVLRERADKAKKDTEALEHLSEPWASLLGRVESVVDLSKRIAEVHPYAKLAWNALSAAYTGASNQVKRDDKIKELLAAMEDSFDLFEYANEKGGLQHHHHRLQRLFEQTIECAQFLSSYARNKSFVKRAGRHLFSGADEAINKYIAKFEEIRRSYTTMSTARIEITTIAILNDIGLEIDFSDMPYARGARYQSAKQCMKGTRTSVLDKICEWVSDLEDKRRMFVFLGPAGVGKSSIASSVARWADEKTWLGSSFCFDRSDITNRHPATLFPTIARDLADHDPMFYQSLGELIKGHKSLRNTSDVQEQFDKLISTHIRNISPSRPVLIVIDALDESGEAEAIFRILLAGLSSMPQNIRILVTSRESSIREQSFDLNLVVPFVNPLEVHGSSSKNMVDVRLYIEHQLRNSGIAPEDLGSLIRKSEGLFQWAAVACGFINGPEKPSIREKRLRNLLSEERNVLGLYQLYDAVLSEIIKQEAIGTFASIVGTVLLLREPLPMPALMSIWISSNFPAKKPEHEFRSVVESLGTLLSGVSDKSTPVRPRHTSFRDYLLDQHSQKFQISSEECETKISEACLAIMNEQLRFNICHLESSHLRNSEVPHLENQLQEYISQDLRYASSFWDLHISQVKAPNEAILTHLRQFAEEKLLQWLEVLSLINGMDRTYQLSINLARILTMLPNDVADLLSDTCQVVQQFGTALSEAASHVYVSVIPFLPRHCALAKQLRSQSLRSAHVLGCHLNQWPRIQRIIGEHHTYIASVAFSADGRWIISASESSDDVKIWDGETGRLRLSGCHKSSFWSVAISPEGKSIACQCFEENTSVLQVWAVNLETGAPIKKYQKQHTGYVSKMIFSSDSKQLAFAGERGACQAYLWNFESDVIDVIHECGGVHPLSCLSFSPDGNTLAMGCVQGELHTRDLVWRGTMILLPFSEHDGGRITSLSYTPDGSKITVGRNNGNVMVVESATGKVLHRYESKSGPVEKASVTPDGNFVVSATHETVQRWSIASGLSTGDPLHFPGNSMAQIDLSYDCLRLVFSTSRMIRLWHVDFDKEFSHQWKVREGLTRVSHLSLDGRCFTSYHGRTGGGLRVWEVATGVLRLGPLERHRPALSSDGSLLAVIQADDPMNISSKQTTEVWDTVSKQVVMKVEKGFVQTVFTPDGANLIGLSWDGRLEAWDVASNTLLYNHDIRLLVPNHPEDDPTLSLEASSVSQSEAYQDNIYRLPTKLMISSDSKRLFVGYEDYLHQLGSEIHIFSTDTGQRLLVSLVAEPKSYFIKDVAGAPDNVVFRDRMQGKFRFWSLENANPVFEREVDLELEDIVAIEACHGDWMLTGDWNGNIMLLDSQTGKWVGRVHQGERAMSLVISQDGKTFLTATADSVLRCWDAAIMRNIGSIDPMDWRRYTFSSKYKHAINNIGEFKMEEGRDRRVGTLLRLDFGTGWILGPNDELVLWVPGPYRDCLWLPGTVRLYGEEDEDIVELDMSSMAHGDRWTDCLTPV